LSLVLLLPLPSVRVADRHGAGLRPGGRPAFFASPKKVGKGPKGDPLISRSEVSGYQRRPGCGGPRCARTSLRCSVGGHRRGTRYVGCAHCARTAAASQFTKRTARAAPRPALLGTAYGESVSARFALPRPMQRCDSSAAKPKASRAGFPSVAARSAGGRAARDSAHPHLTRRVWSSAVSAANEASYATGPAPEHHSGVGLQGRPPQPGVLSLPTFFAQAKKVGRPPGRDPAPCRSGNSTRRP
jgi:hypothetical protein